MVFWPGGPGDVREATTSRATTIQRKPQEGTAKVPAALQAEAKIPVAQTVVGRTALVARGVK